MALVPLAAATDLSTHAADTTAVHGVDDTAALVTTDDARLSDARTPTAHATSHASGGTDAIAPADIGAEAAGTAASAVSAHADDIASATALGHVKVGTGLSIDAAGVLSATGGGAGGGAVDSVNGQTGVVVLDATDVGAAAKGEVEAFVDATADNDAARPTGFARVHWKAADSASPPTNAAVDDVVEYLNDPAPYTSSDADTAATASKLVLRDAAGRAQVADPAVDADIATKGYVDTAVAGAGGGGGGGLPFTRVKYTGFESFVIPGVILNSAASTSLTLVSGPLRTYQQAIEVDAPIQVDSFNINVTSALAGNFEAAIYAQDANGLATGAALVTSGSIDMSTTGAKSGITTATVLAAGKYVLQYRGSANATLGGYWGAPKSGSLLMDTPGAIHVASLFNSGGGTFGAWNNPGLVPTNVVAGDKGTAYHVWLKVTPQ